MIVCVEEDIDAGINFHSESLVGGESGGLDARGSFFVEGGRAEILAADATAEGRIFVFVIVISVWGDDFDDGESDVVEDGDGELAALDEFLDEEIGAERGGLGDGLGGFGLRFHDVNADAGAFARGFDDEGSRKAWKDGAVGGVENFGGGSRDVFREKFDFRFGFIEGDAAAGDACAGVGDAEIFELLLKIAVFAEGSVDEIEGEGGAFGELNFSRGDVHGDGVVAGVAEGIENGFARGERNLAFVARAAHEDGDEKRSVENHKD